jgi:hypothetical protein
VVAAPHRTVVVLETLTVDRGDLASHALDGRETVVEAGVEKVAGGIEVLVVRRGANPAGVAELFPVAANEAGIEGDGAELERLAGADLVGVGVHVAVSVDEILAGPADNDVAVKEWHAGGARRAGVDGRAGREGRRDVLGAAGGVADEGGVEPDSPRSIDSII